MQLPAGARSTDPSSFESLFLGAPIGERPDLVRKANPITYVRPSLPLFLIMHGLSDHAVPAHQSELLYKALARTGNDATLILIEGIGHGFFNRNDFGAKIYPTKVRSTRDAAQFAGEPPGFAMVLRFLRSTFTLGPH